MPDYGWHATVGIEGEITRDDYQIMRKDLEDTEASATNEAESPHGTRPLA